MFAEKSYLFNFIIQISKISFHIVKNAFTEHISDMTKFFY